MVDIAPTFSRILITDVIAAREQLSQSDNQAHRRNLIRTTFAAIEGLVWLLREHLESIGTDLDRLSPMDKLALNEIGYSVSQSGVLRRTSQRMPLRTAIRYAIRVVQKIEPSFAVDYTQPGWDNLITAIEVRHRITHPKNSPDLVVQDAEIEATSRGLDWFLAVVEEGMRASMAALRILNEEMAALLIALKRGDPTALRLYNEALAASDET